MESENDQVSPQLSPYQIAQQTSHCQECPSEEEQESCRVGARNSNTFHRHERQATEPASGKAGQTQQKQKEEQHIYPSDILSLG